MKLSVCDNNNNTPSVLFSHIFGVESPFHWLMRDSRKESYVLSYPLSIISVFFSVVNFNIGILAEAVQGTDFKLGPGINFVETFITIRIL